MKRAAPLQLNKKPQKKRRALSVTQLVHKELARSADVKHTDRTMGTSTIDFSGEIRSLYINLARGTGNENAFIGNKLTPTGVTVRYQVAHTGISSSSDYSTIRVIVFQNKGAGTPSQADILESVSSVYAVISPPEADMRTEIKILSDRVYDLGYFKASQWDKVYIPGSKLDPLVVSAAASFSLVSGDIGILMISDDGVTPYPTCTFMSRITYTDV